MFSFPRLSQGIQIKFQSVSNVSMIKITLLKNTKHPHMDTKISFCEKISYLSGHSFSLHGISREIFSELISYP